MNFRDKIKLRTRFVKNIACMGIDPILEYFPRTQNQNVDNNFLQKTTSFYLSLFSAMQKEGLEPAAFKPNIGYFSCMDRPFSANFQGSLALSKIIILIKKFFPHALIILDSKRGDIQRSSQNYSHEAFDVWKTDALTLSPYMGHDSIEPFLQDEKCAYVLTLTSNKGRVDFQEKTLDSSLENWQEVALFIQKINNENPKFCLGSVLGALDEERLYKALRIFAKINKTPILIPGVGNQGADERKVIELLDKSSYDKNLCLINSSSALSFPWKKTGSIPQDKENWQESCLHAIEKFIKNCSI